MVKNTLNNFYLTDEYEEDAEISINALENKTSEKSKLDTFMESDIFENEMIDVVDNSQDDVPKIEFIVEEDENKEKQIRMNFEFRVNDSNELIKIDLEISKSIYLEIADELLK